ncbi:zinc-binding protein [Methanoculleus taiwanensis]|uniref:Zinc-binding protein n=1 Tax=Methanoculleus taiwanensis TaxID=1550565 RepID=A0A498H048_9EURY|nr:putative zinc-binding protein [Methanoculleus taiwanensis]RXE55715.1 zinc-binding protein [Methanoculleus taiwanensis]
MTKQNLPRCACGGGEEPEGGTKRIIFACAGVANVGQLSNLAAIQLTQEGYGSAACVALLAAAPEGLTKSIGEADEVLVIDGCPVRCAEKIAVAKGITPDQHLVVTVLGIAKKSSLEFSDADLETVVSAVWEGKGRGEEEKKCQPSGGCGCGGGGCC